MKRLSAITLFFFFRVWRRAGIEWNSRNLLLDEDGRRYAVSYTGEGVGVWEQKEMGYLAVAELCS